jgi:hypothetical protein
LEARVGRRVRSGKEYDHLFPRPEGRDITQKKNADVSDTVKFIQDIVPATLGQTKKIASLKKGKSLGQTCSNYWEFVYEHIPYKRDEDGVEQVRTPARAWYDRNHADEEGKVGVDCDCYTVFLSSMLTNAGIAHKYRITKYPKKPPEVPSWQHIYIVVPKDGKLDYELKDRKDYITMDCVKNEYDSEQPYLEARDFNMKLDLLNGIDDGEYEVPKTMDAKDLASIYEEEDLGKLGQWLKKTAKKVGSAAGKAIHTLNRVNPATLLLRNGFLLCMKINLMNVAKRLRYAYLTDQQAQSMGIDLTALAHLRKIKDKAETIYWQAGGKKENLQKAILSGKGNKDGKVPKNLSGLGEIYGDEDENNILYSGSISGLGQLGEPVEGAAIAAATAAITAVAGALSQVKGLFKPGTKGSESMATNNDPSAGGDTTQDSLTQNSTTQDSSDPNADTTNNTSDSTAVSNQSGAGSQSSLTTVQKQDSSDSSQLVPADQNKVGIMGKATAWVKENPGKTVLIAAAVGTGAYFIFRKKPAARSSNLSGFKERRKNKKKNKSKAKITAIRIT